MWNRKVRGALSVQYLEYLRVDAKPGTFAPLREKLRKPKRGVFREGTEALAHDKSSSVIVDF